MTCFPSACFMYIDWRNEKMLISICCHIKKMWTTSFPKLYYVWMILQRSRSWACIQFWAEMNQLNKEAKLNYFYPYFIPLTCTFSAPPSIIYFSLTVTVSLLKSCLARKMPSAFVSDPDTNEVKESLSIVLGGFEQALYHLQKRTKILLQCFEGFFLLLKKTTKTTTKKSLIRGTNTVS